MEAGQIYIDKQFYCSPDTGQLLPKYFLVLAFDSAGDVVSRLLTSRKNGRPEDPRCFHGLPYPGFHFGILCGALPKPTWLDLRALEDFDRKSMDTRLAGGSIELVHVISGTDLVDALTCTAGADDTTTRQERAIRDQLAALNNKK